MYTMGMEGKKWEIFSASVELFAEHNYHNVGVREIADRVGLKTGSIYNYYGAKDDLLRLIYQYFIDCQARMMPDADRLMTEVEYMPPRDLLRKVLIDSYPHEEDKLYQGVFLIVMSQSCSDPRAEAVLDKALIEPTRDLLRRILGKLVELGKIPPLDVESFLFTFSGISYYISYRAACSRQEYIQQWFDALDWLIDGVLLPGTGADAQ